MMVQLERRTFVVALVLAVVAGGALDAFTATRAELRRSPAVAQTPVAPEPLVPPFS